MTHRRCCCGGTPTGPCDVCPQGYQISFDYRIVITGTPPDPCPDWIPVVAVCNVFEEIEGQIYPCSWATALGGPPAQCSGADCVAPPWVRVRSENPTSGPTVTNWILECGNFRWQQQAFPDPITFGGLASGAFVGATPCITAGEKAGAGFPFDLGDFIRCDTGQPAGLITNIEIRSASNQTLGAVDVAIL